MVSAYPNTKWISTFDGGNDDEAYCVVEAYDGGFALAGITNSFDHNNYDFWLIKTNEIGEEQWNMTYGESGDTRLMSMVRTDNSYVLAGSIKDQSNETWLDNNDDVWLVKTDSEGNILWNKTFGGSEYDRAKSIIVANDGGYVLACETRSFGGGGADFWLVKTDSDGVIEWNMTYGGEENEYGGSLVVDNNENYWIACIQQPTLGDGHFWLLETDLDGIVKSNQTYTISAHHSSTSIINTNNGDLAIVYSSRDSGEYRDITLIVIENVKLNSIIPIILGVIVIFLIILFLVLYFKRKKYRI